MKRAGPKVALLWLCAAAPARAELPAHPAASQAGLEARPGARLPLELRFRAARAARPVSLEQAIGALPTLFVLAYARCPLLCSLVLDALARAARGLPGAPGKDFRLVTLSIDPNESRASAAAKQRALVRRLGLPPARAQAWSYLTGTAVTIRRVADAVGFEYAWDEQTNQFAHPAVVFVLTPGGRVSSYVQGLDLDPRELSSALERARRGEIVRRSGLVETVLRCFRFDPASRRYGTWIAAGLRGAALLLVAAVGLFVWRFARGRVRR